MLISPGHSLAADGCCCPVRVISQLSQPSIAQPAQPSPAQPCSPNCGCVQCYLSSSPVSSAGTIIAPSRAPDTSTSAALRTHHKEQRLWLYIITEYCTFCTFCTFLTATRYLLFASKLREVCSISFVFGVSLNHKGSTYNEVICCIQMEFSHGERLSVCLCHGKTSVAIALTYSYTPKLLLALMIFWEWSESVRDEWTALLSSWLDVLCWHAPAHWAHYWVTTHHIFSCQLSRLPRKPFVGVT